MEIPRISELKEKYGNPESLHVDYVRHFETLWDWDSTLLADVCYGWTEVVTVNGVVKEINKHSEFIVTITEQAKQRDRESRQLYLQEIVESLEDPENDWEDIGEIVEPSYPEYEDY